MEASSLLCSGFCNVVPKEVSEYANGVPRLDGEEGVRELCKNWVMSAARWPAAR